MRAKKASAAGNQNFFGHDHLELQQTITSPSYKATGGQILVGPFDWSFKMNKGSERLQMPISDK